MDWIAGLQSAVDYVEEHLTERLDYGEIAKRACSSSFHFQRIFGILCGYTLGEYIRNRRLALAGGELASSRRKVIDIALKYGYDSPESFGRAFFRFHGITPSQARAGGEIKSFSRLFVKLILEGGTTMDYRIEKKGPIPVVLKKARFAGGKEYSKTEVQGLWKRCGEDGTIPSLCQYIRPGNVFGEAVVGICYDNPEVGDFDYGIGSAYGGGEVTKGLSLEEIPANTWAVFPCNGPMPGAFEQLWKKIYTEFFPGSNYQPSGGMCLEVYPGAAIENQDYHCEIWISVAEKPSAQDTEIM